MKWLLSILFFATFSETTVSRVELNAYLNNIGFKEAIGSQVVVILPLHQDYYVDNHWLQLMNIENCSFPDVGFVIVEKDTSIVAQLVTNSRIKLQVDQTNEYSRTSFYAGRPIVLERKDGVYEITTLYLANAYQKRMEVFRSVRRN